MSNFRVGQKVVCVDDKNQTDVRRGCIYTISGIINVSAFSHFDGSTAYGGVKLLEAKPIRGNSFGFDARRFRPVVERKTDISIFKAMLNTSPAIVEQYERVAR